jgi:hypothetical protein
MGYYSDFDVDGTDIPFVADVLNDASAPYQWSEYNKDVYLHSAKWYRWLTDLEKIAKLFPDNYLIIKRYGEERGDISRAVVANGTVIEQVPRLVWPSVQLGKGNSTTQLRTENATKEEGSS